MKSKKGIELPVNALIIIVLALIVLGAAFAIFGGVFPKGKTATSEIGDYNSACARYVSGGCCKYTDAAGGIATNAPEGCKESDKSAAKELAAGGRARCCAS